VKKKLRITVEGKTYEVEVEELETSGAPKAPVSKETVQPKPQTPAPRAETKIDASPAPAKPAAPTAEGEKVSAPIPGKILSINVKAGDKVSSGDQLLILEAMKMENEISAPTDGEIKEILVTEGQAVQTGDVLVVIG
jgi:glutaconyl-CoA decarboxylase